MNEYQREDARLRLAFERSRGCKTVDTIARAANCSLGDAWRVHVVREHASGMLLDAWTHERMSWRKLWRLVTDNPFDGEAQVRASNLAASQKVTARPRLEVLDDLVAT